MIQRKTRRNITKDPLKQKLPTQTSFNNNNKKKCKQSHPLKSYMATQKQFKTQK